MGAIRPGSGGGGGASALGDLSDIGVMGEDIGQADDLTEVVTAMGGAAAVRTALDVAQDGPTVTYTLGGSPHDYTAASDYALTGVTAVSGASTGLLGGADGIPPFHALTKGSIAALARNSTGLRLTHATANSGTHSYPYADAAPTLRLPLSRLLTDVQIDLTFAVDLPTRAAGGSDLVAAFAGVCRAATGARDYVLGGAWLVSHPPVHSSAPAELAWALSAAGGSRTTDTARDVSAGGEGTSGTTTARGLRVILRGATVEVLTGPAGGSLTRRCYYSDPELVTARDGLALVVSLAQNRATPAAGYWIELRALTITPL